MLQCWFQPSEWEFGCWFFNSINRTIIRPGCAHCNARNKTVPDADEGHDANVRHLHQGRTKGGDFILDIWVVLTWKSGYFWLIVSCRHLHRYASMMKPKVWSQNPNKSDLRFLVQRAVQLERCDSDTMWMHVDTHGYIYGYFWMIHVNSNLVFFLRFPLQRHKPHIPVRWFILTFTRATWTFVDHVTTVNFIASRSSPFNVAVASFAQGLFGSSRLPYCK